MAKKNSKKSSKKTKQASKKRPQFNKQQIIAVLAVLIITFIVFLPSLQNDFVNWDDDKNFYENPLVVNSTDLGKLIKNTPAIFSTPIIGNYNPLSNWTFALENAIFGLDNPFNWHLDNLLIHLFCVFMIFRISMAMGLKLWASVICALLFGIHPMRVESVAWVTERKDVLFGAFYLTAIFYYLKGLKAGNASQHLIKILILFVLSGLSKIQAVTLPLSMLAIDYFMGRPIEWKRLTEKWIYFALSLGIGLLGVIILRQNGSLSDVATYAFYDRIFIGSYSYIVYFIKVLFPYQLLPLYPYPPSLGLIHYASMLPALGIIAFTYWAYLKEWKGIVFGILFFTFNIMFLLQIVGAGQGFLADRFTYIAYFGFFFSMAYYLQKLYSNKKNGTIVNGIAAVFLVAMSYLTYNQTKIWKNSDTLWSHTLEYYENATLPWGNRANYYRDSGQRTKALHDYNKALELGSKNPNALNSRGKLYFMSNSRDTIQLALQDYTAAINLSPDFAEYYMNRGATYARLQSFQLALQDLMKAAQLDPNNKTVYLNRSIVFHNMGQYQNEINDINTYLSMDENNPNMWANRANSKMMLGQWSTALPDINRAITINPNAGVYYFYRAQYYYNTGNSAAAQQDLNSARQLGFQVNDGLESLKM